MTNEEFYDAEIAPVLAELAKKCADRQMNFHAAIINGDDVYRTQYMPVNGIVSRMIDYTIRAAPNADNLISALVRDGRENGHNSIYLNLLIEKQNQWTA